MTLSETLTTATLAGIVLVVLMLGMDGIRTELKRRQTLDLIETLDRALAAYHKAAGAWPVVPEPPSGQSSLMENSPRSESGEESGDSVLAVLAALPASQTVLQAVPAILRVPPSGDVLRWTTTASGGVWGGIRDSWGRPLCCLTAASPSAVHRKAVAANENRPIFISAGPDGDFGFVDAASASDNLRSDEPRR